MSHNITQTQDNVQDVVDNVIWFLKKFHVNELLRTCGASKVKGFSVAQIFFYLFTRMFSPISTYMAMQVGSYKGEFSKNTIYRFCNNPVINWHKFLRTLSAIVIRTFVRPATSDSRVESFIFDDTPQEKFGKKTELVSKFYNHVTNKYAFGMRVLTLLWTDDYTNIPVDFCPLASNNPNLIRCSAKAVDKRSIAGRIRSQAQKPAPEVLLNMLKTAIAAGHKAKYVLFDSWFSTPKLITAIKNEVRLDVIAIIKKSSKVYYEYNGKQYNVKQLYSMNRKRRGKSKYLLSLEVNLIQKEGKEIISRIPSRIVIVRNNKNRKEWIAIITTDMAISEEEIIKRYGARWNIETVFKICKQYLKLLKECNSPSFDAYTCHVTIVFVRYMMLSVCQRANSDDRTVGELFWIICAEVEETQFSTALHLIFLAMIETVQEYFKISDDELERFVGLFLTKLPENLKNSLYKCDGGKRIQKKPA